MTTQLLKSLQPRAAKVIHHLTWEQLEELDRSLEDFEDFKVTIRRSLEAYMEEADIRFYGRGGPTLGTKELKARNEPDESYNIDSKKPYPDLVIEVTVTSGGVDKLEAYRRMGGRSC